METAGRRVSRRRPKTAQATLFSGNTGITVGFRCSPRSQRSVANRTSFQAPSQSRSSQSFSGGGGLRSNPGRQSFQAPSQNRPSPRSSPKPPVTIVQRRRRIPIQSGQAELSGSFPESPVTPSPKPPGTFRRRGFARQRRRRRASAVTAVATATAPARVVTCSSVAQALSATRTAGDSLMGAYFAAAIESTLIVMVLASRVPVTVTFLPASFSGEVWSLRV